MCVQMAGKPDIYSSAGRPHGQFYSERAERKVYVVVYVYDCNIHEGLPESV